ncbi:MAG: hypothetical protein RSD57_17355 [Comamonas sp.]
MITDTAFSSVTLKQATDWLAQLILGKRLGRTAVTFVGDWAPYSSPRRFVIAGISTPKTSITMPTPNIEAQTISIPLDIAAEDLYSELRRFGARVERRQRDLNNRFDFVGDSAGVGHTVHAYHHVALCGSKGPWVLGLTSSTKCPDCVSVAATKPKHRARYVPLQPAG